MTHVLNIEVPDEIYQPLRARAQQAGQTLDIWIANRLRAEAEISGDPMERFIGAFSSTEADRDWADNHDQHLAAQAEREMHDADRNS